MLTLSLILVIALGALSIAYGVITAKDVLSRDPGSPRMQEIALAIQEGASAYLKRQYGTIAIVGVVLSPWSPGALAWWWPLALRLARCFRVLRALSA